MRIALTLQNGQVVENFCEKKQVIVGRSLKCDFTVQDEALSRSHCLIELEGSDFFITDLESSNGVFVDGNKIEPNVRTPLSTFQQLRLGALDCVVLDDPTKPRVAVPPQHNYHPSSVGQEFLADEEPLQRLLELDKPLASAEGARGKHAKKPFKKSGNAPVIRSRNTQDESKSSSGPFFSALFFFAVLSYFGYETFKEKPHKRMTNPESSPQLQNTQSALGPADYIDIASQASCRAQTEICADLGLNENDGEGVYQKDAEIFISIKPSLHRTKEGFDSITKIRLVEDLIALQTFFNSHLFSRFLNNQATQIHLMVKDANSHLYTVYRLTDKDFANAINIKEKIAAALKEGHETLDFSNFWVLTKPFLHAMPIEKQ